MVDELGDRIEPIVLCGSVAHNLYVWQPSVDSNPCLNSAVGHSHISVLLAKIRNPKTHRCFVEVICLNIKTVNITFHVSDFLEAVSFYENILGLQKKSQWSTYAVFDLCGIMLGLEPGGERGVKIGIPDIYLQVDNVDDVYEELKGKGVRFLTEPKDQSWRARTVKFVDPDGNMFILVQLKK